MSKEDFSRNLKLLSEAELREKLAGDFDPGQFFQAMEKLINEMGANFKEAFKSDGAKFDEVVSDKMKEISEESELGLFELMWDVEKLFRYTLVNSSICYLAGEKLGVKFKMGGENLEHAIEFLLDLQSRSRAAVEVELSTELLTPEAKNKEYYKKLVNEDLSRLERSFNLRDVFFWDNHEYDFKTLHLNLQKIEESMAELSEEEKKWLKDDRPRIVLGLNSSLSLTSVNELVISLKWDTISNYKKDLKRLIREYHIFCEAQKKMADFVVKMGGNTALITWSNEIYEAEQLDEAVDAFITAFAALSPGENALFKEYWPTIVMGKAEGIVLNGVNAKRISLDYKNPARFLAALKNGIHQYRCFKDTSKELQALAGKYGSEEIGLWGNVVYNYEEVYKNLITFRRAMEQLSQEQLEIMKESNVRIILTRSNPGLVTAREGYLVIAVDYRESYENMVNAINKALKKTDITSALSTQHKPRPDEFLSDPLLKGIEYFTIPKDLEAQYQGNPKDLKIMILRNLNLRKKAHTPENILAESERIMMDYFHYEGLDLFAKRNVVMASNNEKFRNNKTNSDGKEYTEDDYKNFETNAGGEYRFGSKATREVLNGEAQEVKFIRSKDDSPEALANSKQEILNSIRWTPPPFTFVFDGHGEETKVVLMNQALLQAKWGTEIAQKIVDAGDNVLNAKEIAEAILERNALFPMRAMVSPEEKDIFIFEACESNNLLVDIFQRLEQDIQNDSGLPILISSAEFKQYGFSSFGNRFGGRFFSDVLGMADLEAGRTTTINVGTVIKNQERGNSNPTVFIPSLESNLSLGKRYMQLGRNERKSSDSSKAS